MGWRRPSLAWSALLSAGMAAALPLSSAQGRAWQRLRKTPELRAADYGFVNFNQDRLEIAFSMRTSDFRRYNDQYGYRPEDIEALRDWRDKAKQAAYRDAVKRKRGQAELDADCASIDAEYGKKLREYLASKGFRLDGKNVTRIDMRAVVERNAPLVAPLSRSFDRVASQRGYRSTDIIGAVLSFVQTALDYKEPRSEYKGKHTGGVLPPLTAVLLGWGDCDTKTALLASILGNWAQMRMVGVSVPGHYLMGVLQIPDRGDVFVEHEGLQYVLVEPAGPAWLPPGQVAEETLVQLQAAEGYKIEPFF